MTAPRRRRLALVWLGLALFPGAATLAASPSATPQTSAAPGPFPNVEVWLDAEFTPAAVPGSVVEAGITFWDTEANALARIDGVYTLLRPAEGDAEPSVGTARSDFPGHMIVEFVVPEGGPGSIEVGVEGRVCMSDGACAKEKLPFKLAGTGPPPEADVSQLIDAQFHSIVGDLVAGREFPVSIDVFPRGRWDVGALDFPDRIVVTAALRGGRDLGAEELGRRGGPGTTYAGSLTIPEAGNVTLEVAVPGDGGPDEVIASATTVVTVIEAGGDAGEEPIDPGAADADVDIPLGFWLVGIGVLVVVGLVARRALADL
jgi:hypothetical protein